MDSAMMMMTMMVAIMTITAGMTMIDWHKMMMVIIMMTVNKQAIHSFDSYGDDETKVVVSVTKMLTY